MPSQNKTLTDAFAALRVGADGTQATLPEIIEGLQSLAARLDQELTDAKAEIVVLKANGPAPVAAATTVATPATAAAVPVVPAKPVLTGLALVEQMYREKYGV